MSTMTFQPQRTLEAYARRLRAYLQEETPFQLTDMDSILSAYQDVAIFDHRLFRFDVSSRIEGQQVILDGEVSLRELKTGLLTLLEYCGIESVEDNIKILPVKKPGTQILAVVHNPIVPLYKEPNAQSEQISQLLIGDGVEILKRNRNYSLVQGPDGYLGWMPSEGLCTCESDDLQKWISMPRVAFIEPVDLENISIPLGAELPLIERGMVLLPINREVRVREASYRALKWLKQPQRQTVVNIAKRFLGVPYLWGGKSMAGIDCSGLVQMAYRGAGIYLSRDANQQFLVGRLVATRNYQGEMMPGDLLYFAGMVGNISHIAISLGGSRYIHACDKGVVINSLDPKEPEFDASRAESFVYAKRLIQ